MNPEQLAQLEASFKTAAEKVINENMKTVVDPMVETKVKALFDNLSLQSVINAKNRSGISNAAKKEFAEKIKAMSEGTTTAGGFLVPEEVRAGVMRIVEDYGLVRKFATKLPMSSDTMNVPVQSTSVTIYWPGENTAGTASQPVLGNVSLVAKTAVGLTAVSNELLADANISVTDYLVEIFAEALATEEDKQGLVGTGAPFTGIVADSNVTVVTMASGQDTFAETLYSDLIDLRSNVKASVLKNGAYVMHRSVWGIVQKLNTGTGGVYIFAGANPGNSFAVTGGGYGVQPAGYIDGYPVFLNDQMPSTTAVSTIFMIFGDLSKLLLGDREQMTIGMSDSATVATVNAFAANQKVLRVTERVAIAVGLPSAFAVLKTAAS